MPYLGYQRFVCLALLTGIIVLRPAALGAWQTPAARPHSDAVWEIQESMVTASLRGLSVVDRQVAWASGTGGTVLRTTDGGSHWQNVSIAAAADLDFRDIQAWDADVCVVLNAGSPGCVYRTTDGGQHWQPVYRNESPTIFFDALVFWDPQHGLAVSDPQAGRYYLIATSDGGETWHALPPEAAPAADHKEACFAASGTSLAVREDNLVWLATGGDRGTPEAVARVFSSADRGQSWSVAETPLRAGESAGIFSMAFANVDHGVVVGGDFRQESSAAGNVAITDNGGLHWRVGRGQPPRGYRSCVAVLRGASEPLFVTVGPSGTDVSFDWGNAWLPLSDIGFHALSFTPDGTAGWAVGGQGRIARFIGQARLQELQQNAPR